MRVDEVSHVKIGPNYAVVPAGGSGQRFGAAIPKVLAKLQGLSVLERTLSTLLRSELFQQIVVPCHPQVLAQLPPTLSSANLTFIEGAETRQKSVYTGLVELQRLGAPSNARVLIHDAARCLVSQALLQRCLEMAWCSSQPVTAALPQIDSLKLVSPEGVILKSVARDGLWNVQTPQVFEVEMLLAAHQRAQAAGINDAGDDIALVAELQKPLVVCGERSNLKITLREDLELACAWLALSGN
jgi:2-C-methyl-D-erythritol 4-phosphate cytidylyltransferase